MEKVHILQCKLRTALSSLLFVSFYTMVAQSNWSSLHMPTGTLPFYNTYSIELKNNDVYVGTDYGLNIYDGTSWINYGYPASFNTCCVMGTAVDNDSTIWLATNDGARFKTTSSGIWQTISYPGLNYFKTVVTDMNNNKWFLAAADASSGTAALLKYDGITWTVYDTSNSGFPALNTYQMKIDATDNIWFLHGSGLSKFDGTTWSYWNMSLWSLAGTTPLTLDFDNSGNVWFTASENFPPVFLVRFDGTTFTSIQLNSIYPYDFIYDLKIDSQGNKWFVDGYNLYKFDGINATTITTPLNCYPYKVNVDDNGTAWVGSGSASNTDEVYLYNENGFNTVSGNIFLDLNNDGLNTSEPLLSNLMVHLQPLNNEILSSSSGYQFGIYDTAGTYSINIDPPAYYQVSTTPVVQTVTQTYSGEISNSLNFGISPVVSVTDLSLDIVHYGFRPGFESGGWIIVSNKGTTTAGDTVTITLDSIENFISSIPAPVAQSGNTIKWVLPPVPPLEYGSIYFQDSISATALLGSTATLFGSANAINDTTPADNIDTLNLIVTGAYDPNNKEVSPKGLTANGFIPQDQKLSYTIFFQNTGTDTAVNIVIKDSLSLNLDLSTLHIIGSSAPVTIQLNGRVLTFTFHNIMLPDSNISESASHGFVKYTIDVISSLAPGTAIENKAYIFFDYNVPVITNTALNTIEFPLAVEQVSKANNQFMIVPNPASDHVQFVLINEGRISQLEIYDVTGNKIRDEKLNSQFKKADVSALAPGVYLARLKIDGNWFSQRFIKN
jgi:uncharacterized repeat protein (TIGR01451 family)